MAIERAVLAQFPNVTCSGTPSLTTTGELEVKVGGELVHSKLSGDGYVDSPEKIERILNAVAKATGAGAR